MPTSAQSLCWHVARIFTIGVAVAVATIATAVEAMACGPDGYVYAGGVAAPVRAFGIRAIVTSVGPVSVRAGHVAGWLGVGGPRQGPGRANEWLQVGLSDFRNQKSESLYYEVAVPGARPAYHLLAARLPIGRPVELEVLEISSRPNWWRVLVDGSPKTQPIYLPGSDHRWAPIVTAESWNGAPSAPCTNTFLYRFQSIRIARSRGGGWRPLEHALSITYSTTRVRGSAAASFLAAGGAPALRVLASMKS
jgi:hypothetical protein